MYICINIYINIYINIQIHVYIYMNMNIINIKHIQYEIICNIYMYEFIHKCIEHKYRYIRI